MTKTQLIVALTELFEKHPELPDPSSVSVILGPYGETMPLADVIATFPSFSMDRNSIFEDGNYAMLYCTLGGSNPLGFSVRVKLSELGQKEVTRTEYALPERPVS